MTPLGFLVADIDELGRASAKAVKVDCTDSRRAMSTNCCSLSTGNGRSARELKAMSFEGGKLDPPCKP
ncbi:hypothetical protein RTBOTA2_005126 [Rhodotorula toruloides]|nr:hypothetical protein RTBOTA2_005126 [Rhodotorula toruloides]